MNREELVEAGKQALADAWLRGVLLSQDEPGGEWHTDFGKFTATVLDAIEGKVRADERNGRESWAEVVVRADAAIRAEVLADLRAKVEALSAYYTDAGDGIVRADVLALIDGSSK